MVVTDDDVELIREQCDASLNARVAEALTQFSTQASVVSVSMADLRDRVRRVEERILALEAARAQHVIVEDEDPRDWMCVARG